MPLPSPLPTHSGSPAESDYRELLNAMRLLSGKDCKRDPSQAQVLLLRLTGSQRNDIAQDAQSMMRAAMVRDWFEDEVPHYFELERIAATSLKNKEANPQQTALLAVMAGLVALLIGGVLAFNVASGGFDAQPWILAALIGALVVAGLIGVSTRLDKRF